jgi:AraC family transcriptional regulator of adaptative response / DNA-3-methyladenine glycosylase II
MPPTRLRKKAVEDVSVMNGSGTSTLQLSYRPPYDWHGMLAFLKVRELKGVEWVTEDFYARTVQMGKHRGWIKVTQSKTKHALMMEFTHSLSPVLPALLNRVRGLFDLAARPEIISKHLAKDAVLGPLVKANAGMRVPGAFSGFELGLRAILGQQVTVKSATTVAGRFVAAFGEPMVTPFAELNRLTPTPDKLARASVDKLTRLGIVSARCKSILGLAQAQASGKLSLDSGNHHDPEATIARLAELPGIGLWTANYIAMRALRWPDAFPKEDIAVRNNLGGVTAKQAEEMSQAWRPWRSYAVMYVWKKLTTN